MKIYDELTGAELTAPDESAGYLYAGQRVVRHVPEHDEILEGTDGWRHRIPAHDEYEACQYYHAYTEAELAERDKLRRIYIDSVKANLTGQLENTYLLRPDGTKQKLEKKK